MKSLINDIEELGKFVFTAIPNGSMKETSITDFILSNIDCGTNKSSYIQFDDTYKETGNRMKDPKKGTSADYVLIIKNKDGDIKKYAFQAKNGKLKSRKGNVYVEINHQVGGKGAFQIDEFDSFLECNKEINGYYIFYNGDYQNVDNISNISNLLNQSFWILDEKKIKELMGKECKILSIDDIITEANHQNFIEFLRGLNNE